LSWGEGGGLEKENRERKEINQEEEEEEEVTVLSVSRILNDFSC